METKISYHHSLKTINNNNKTLKEGDIKHSQQKRIFYKKYETYLNEMRGNLRMRRRIIQILLKYTLYMINNT